jgi:hypothetical protein
MRDLEVIDSELRLLLAIRKMACEVDGNGIGLVGVLIVDRVGPILPPRARPARFPRQQ